MIPTPRSSPRAAARAALVLTAVLAGAPAARAASGPCLPERGSPQCTFWFGKVRFVADGDTMDVRIRGEGLRRIRLTGINAMEQTVYSKYRARRRGACHALAATARLQRLVRAGHRRVRLAAQNPSSVSGGRLRRQVSVRIGGQWVDAGAVLVAEGHALWLPNTVEYAWNRTYSRLSQMAAAHHLRLFDPGSCGTGPSWRVQPRMRLRWDARGNDGANVNGEWARIRNPSSRRLRLGGWRFRDSAARSLRFPRGTVVPPHRSVIVHVGQGQSGGRRLYWGLRKPAFDNASGGWRAMGDGAYLFDTRGNLRAFVMYPRRA
jgi:micrococcal nuclease